MAFLNLKGSSLQQMIAVLGAVALFLQGYNQSMMNGFTTLPSFLETLPEVDTVNTTGDQKAHNAHILGLVVAIFEIGSATGALSCVFVGDRLGRPKTMVLAGIILSVGVVLQASTYSLGQILAGRIITGIGTGLYTGTVPMYVSETADARKRGQLVLIEGPVALGGLAFASWVNFGMFYAKGPVSWRFPIALQLAFVAILLPLTLLLPESPRWLVKKDRLPEATEIMARLMNQTVNDGDVRREIATIHASLEQDAGHRSKYSSNPFSMNESRHLQRTLLSVVLMMFVQLSGINVIAFYSTSILQGTLGYSGAISRLISATLQMALALGGFTAIFLVDRVGRRRLMLGSAMCMVIAQAAVAGLSSNLSNPASGKAALFFYFFAMYTMPIGLFSIPFMYAAEIAPLGIRHQVTAMAACCSWLFNFMVAEVTPIGFTNIQ